MSEKRVRLEPMPAWEMGKRAGTQRKARYDRQYRQPIQAEGGGVRRAAGEEVHRAQGDGGEGVHQSTQQQDHSQG